MLQEGVPPRYRDPVLVLLEGDRKAPQRHAMKQLQEENDAVALRSPSKHPAADSSTTDLIDATHRGRLDKADDEVDRTPGGEQCRMSARHPSGNSASEADWC